jgi:hypothetical protein
LALAIITEKYSDGKSKTLRTTAPLSSELRRQADQLDSRVHTQIQHLETELVAAGLLDVPIPATGSVKARGGVPLWHRVGRELVRIAKEAGVRSVRERRWLWEAIDNLYASERLKRASRGKTRMHFEYCFRLAQYPLELASKMNWSEWVYFFDSLTVREEPRADKWLKTRLEAESALDRRTFRRFTENLNRRIRKMDTSILSTRELFDLYDATWQSTAKELAVASPLKGQKVHQP